VLQEPVDRDGALIFMKMRCIEQLLVVNAKHKLTDLLILKPLRDNVIVGGSFDWTILSGPRALHLAKRFWWSGCDCRCLPVEGDPVCGSPQVPPDCRHRQSACCPRVVPKPAGIDDGRPFA